MAKRAKKPKKGPGKLKPMSRKDIGIIGLAVLFGYAVVFYVIISLNSDGRLLAHSDYGIVLSAVFAGDLIILQTEFFKSRLGGYQKFFSYVFIVLLVYSIGLIIAPLPPFN